MYSEFVFRVFVSCKLHFSFVCKRNLLTNQQFGSIILLTNQQVGENVKNRYEIFTVLINNINRNIKKIRTEEMKEYNLKSSHVSCLYYLYNRGSLTSAELTELCDEDKAAISRSLDFLETNGYLIKGKNKNHYNCKIILTEKGIEVGKYISSRIEGILAAVDESIAKENRVIFYETLKIIENSLRRF